jgi:NAD(P)H-hydrate epimerase
MPNNDESAAAMKQLLNSGLVASMLPDRPQGGHKGTFGRLVVIGGSRGLTGAVKLAATAALRSGSGLVTAAVPAALSDVMGAALAEVMHIPLPSSSDSALGMESLEPALDFARKCDAVVLGPGMGASDPAQEFTAEFVRLCAVPMVIDADGLNCLSKRLACLKECEAPCVLTPHPGEMARLVDSSIGEVQEAREETAASFAREHGCVLVLKGPNTIIADGDNMYINTTGNSGMASGGSGDVLSGITASLLGQGMEALEAAAAAVYVHGMAGDVAAQRRSGRGMIAGDIIESLCDVWLQFERGSLEDH